MRDPPRPRPTASSLPGRRQVPQPAALPPWPCWRRPGDGRTIARAETTDPRRRRPPPTSPWCSLPPELRNTITRLVLEGPASAAGTALLDERWRRRPVGLLAAEEGADTPLIGPLFYVRRALAPTAELREGNLDTLLARAVSVIVLADVPLEGARPPGAWPPGWRQGGLLLRFAGPRMAAEPDDAGPTRPCTDPLLPVNAARRRPAAGRRPVLEPASSRSPGSRRRPPSPACPSPTEVLVNRQVLAEPSVQTRQAAAGPPWPTAPRSSPAASRGRRPDRAVPRHGQRRLVQPPAVRPVRRHAPPPGGPLRRRGRHRRKTRSSPRPRRWTASAPSSKPPPRRHRHHGRRAAQAPRSVSPRHPPGLYGPESGRRALNLGAALPPLATAAPVPRRRAWRRCRAPSRERAIGPLPDWSPRSLLLAIDLVLSLWLRGLLRPAAVAAVLASRAGTRPTPPRAGRLPRPRTRRSRPASPTS